MADNQGILICGETVDGELTTTTGEILAAAGKISGDTGRPVSAVLVGTGIEDAARQVIGLGADRVYTAEGRPFSESHPEFYTGIFAAAFRALEPGIVLMGHTDMGRDVAPRLAARLGACVTMDCVELNVDRETASLLVTRPVYGGKALAVWISQFPGAQIITMRPRASMPAQPDALRQGEIISLSVSAGDTRAGAELVEIIKEEARGMKLEEAGIIVSGGGGIGGSEGFRLLEELASVLGGAVGSTRVPCDEGWVPKTMEIGQTGRIVGPDLYVAVGISGAPQHMAGCSESKHIAAINKDPDAPIFRLADFGVVGDYREALPSFIEKCRELREK